MPRDGYDLLYRLGQKSVQFDRMKVSGSIACLREGSISTRFSPQVEYFAPYLLKEGVVQRVQVFPEPMPQLNSGVS